MHAPIFTGIPGESYRRRFRSLLCSCDVFCTLINSLCLLIQTYILKCAVSCCISRDFNLAELSGCGSPILPVLKLKKMLQSFGMLGIWRAQNYLCCKANVKLACQAFARTMWFCNGSMSGGDGMALHSPPPYLQAWGTLSACGRLLWPDNSPSVIARPRARRLISVQEEEQNSFHTGMLFWMIPVISAFTGGCFFK